MDQEKFLQMQMQMRHNNEDYKNFLDDIDSWTTNIKKKEVEFTSKPIDNNIPPIRNIPIAKKSKLKQQKIKGYDYKAWDKFDVDEALKECDDDHTDKTSENNESMYMAEKHKENGNLYFKQGNYSLAIAEYTKAIECNPLSDILFTNRAMCFIKICDYVNGEQDCCEAIKLNNNSVKAYYRRAKCRICLIDKKNEALADLKTVLQIEPSNKVAYEEMKKLEYELNTRGVIEPLSHPIPGKISGKPLIKIDIVEVNPNESLKQILVNEKQEVSYSNVKSGVNTSKSSEDVHVPGIKFKIPQTSVQLAKDLSYYRKNQLNLANYVTLLNCSTYRKLIGHALDCELLLDMINGLSFSRQNDLITDEHFLECLRNLQQVSRFSSTWFMVSNDEKVHFHKAVSMIDTTLINKLPFSI